MWLSADAYDEVAGVTINVRLSLTHKLVLLAVHHPRLYLKLQGPLLVHQPRVWSDVWMY